jgi:hypothetical protein
LVALCLAALFLAFGGFVLFERRSADDELLRSLPAGTGPYSHSRKLSAYIRVALVKTHDEEAAMRGVNFLWRVRETDPSIEPFLENYSAINPSPLVREAYQVLKSERVTRTALDSAVPESIR